MTNPTSPDEWVLVPREPTRDMLYAIAADPSDFHWVEDVTENYRAMLAAAPSSPPLPPHEVGGEELEAMARAISAAWPEVMNDCDPWTMVADASDPSERASQWSEIEGGRQQTIALARAAWLASPGRRGPDGASPAVGEAAPRTAPRELTKEEAEAMARAHFRARWPDGGYWDDESDAAWKRNSIAEIKATRAAWRASPAHGKSGEEAEISRLRAALETIAATRWGTACHIARAALQPEQPAPAKLDGATTTQTGGER